MANKYSMLYVKDLGVGFIHNPKSAGTSITKWFTENFDCIDIRKHGNHVEFFDFFPTASFTFGVVRNPWARLVSWYNFVGTTMTFEDWIAHNFQPYQKIGLTFNPSNKPLTTWYRVCTPQYEWFGDNLDVVIKYENLEAEFSVVKTYTGCTKPLTTENKSATVDYRSYYSDNLATIVGDVFARDIVKYDYEF